jgi:tRNA threonylcarbamoyladenosine biosynthesis protein TsaB
VVEEVTEGPPRKQSERLPGVISDVLARHGLPVNALEGFVVGLGPGSFTGLRIGVATIKALAYAIERPIAGVSSLAAVAWDAPPGELMPLSVARQGELYVGHFRRTQEGLEPLHAERALTPAELAAELTRAPDVKLLGPALGGYQSELEGLGVSPGRFLATGAVPRAECLARLARLPAAYDAASVFALEPHYVRASEAERNPKFPPLAGPEPVARIR